MEYVILVRLTPMQVTLYEKYLEVTGQAQEGQIITRGARLFSDYQNLMKIWTHPWVLKLAEIRDEAKVKFKSYLGVNFMHCRKCVIWFICSSWAQKMMCV